MNAHLLKIYEHLPYPARMMASNLRSAYLAAWRYGPESERLIGEALERERWSAEQWRHWREERLARILHRAATRVPYYRAWWEERRRHGDRSSPEILAHWPMLDKETLRQSPRALVADDRDVRRMYAEHTSGTTGKPIDLWWSRAAVREWFALYELRNRRWHGATRTQPWAILGGQPIVPASRHRPPFWVWNYPTRQLYLSANHISRRNAPSMIQAMRHYRVTHLIAYSSSATALAREALALGLGPTGLQVAITNAEPLHPWQREAIREGLGCEVRETYGMAELVAAASECPHGKLHLWPEVGEIELLDDQSGEPVSAGESGRLICTGLLNPDMPLIRYAVGDRARLEPSEDICACQRTLPILASIEGRSNDLLLARDGRRVYWLNPVLYGIPLSEAQIVQESLDLIRIFCVPAAGFAPRDEATMIDRMRSRMGEVEVRIEKVSAIPRAANGKFQAVVCRVSPSSLP